MALARGGSRIDGRGVLIKLLSYGVILRTYNNAHARADCP